MLRFRPILMTMLVASLGLVPAATSHGIGSDSQRPFAIVIVGGLMAVLVMSIFLLPTLYVWFAREGDMVRCIPTRLRRDLTACPSTETRSRPSACSINCGSAFASEPLRTLPQAMNLSDVHSGPIAGPGHNP